MKHTFHQVGKGELARMMKGTPFYQQVDGNMLPSKFNYYLPNKEHVYLLGNPNATQLASVFTETSFPSCHLPDKYIQFDTHEFDLHFEGDKNTLDYLLPQLCEHCTPRANCAKCPVHQVLEIMYNAYNNYMHGVANSYGSGTWRDEEMEERAKYNHLAPVISLETKNKLIKSACTYCPARKFTDSELMAFDAIDAAERDLGGQYPGEKCLKCPLYTKCVKDSTPTQKSERVFCKGDYVDVDFTNVGSTTKCYVVERDNSVPSFYTVCILDTKELRFIHESQIICNDEEYAKISRQRTNADNWVHTFDTRDTFDF